MQSIIKKEGFDFAFDIRACESCEGNCCIGESGYVWVNPKEIDAIASYLQLSTEDFKKAHLRKVSYRYSLKEVEIKESYVCDFFDLEKKQCRIYEVRPSQCRSFPFWDYFKQHQEEVEKECPGIISSSS